jgi:hypothetical protein
VTAPTAPVVLTHMVGDSSVNKILGKFFIVCWGRSNKILEKIFVFPGEGVVHFFISLESLEKILEKFFVYLYTTYLYKEYNILYYYDIKYKRREE